jgi:hypothetical protein
MCHTFNLHNHYIVVWASRETRLLSKSICNGPLRCFYFGSCPSIMFLSPCCPYQVWNDGLQGFFSVRIHKILGKPYIAFPAYILGIARLIGSLALGIVAFHEPSLTRVRHSLGWLITTVRSKVPIIGRLQDCMDLVAGSRCSSGCLNHCVYVLLCREAAQNRTQW